MCFSLQLILTWGIATLGTFAIQNVTQLYAIRFLVSFLSSFFLLMCSSRTFQVETLTISLTRPPIIIRSVPQRQLSVRHRLLTLPLASPLHSADLITRILSPDPSIHVILASFYTPRELAKRSSLFWCSGHVGESRSGPSYLAAWNCLSNHVVLFIVLSGNMVSGFLQTAAHKNLNGVHGLAGWYVSCDLNRFLLMDLTDE